MPANMRLHFIVYGQVDKVICICFPIAKAGFTCFLSPRWVFTFITKEWTHPLIKLSPHKRNLHPSYLDELILKVWIKGKVFHNLYKSSLAPCDYAWALATTLFSKCQCTLNSFGIAKYPSLSLPDELCPHWVFFSQYCWIRFNLRILQLAYFLTAWTESLFWLPWFFSDENRPSNQFCIIPRFE